MSRLPAFVRRRSELQEEVTSRIVHSVEGMFLLAQLHLESLIGKTSVQAVRNALAKLPSGSDAYYHSYETAMERLNKDALPEIGVMVKVCVGLVTIDEEDGIIRLVHYTTQQYFEGTRATWFPKAENDITTTCVTYLNFQIFKSEFCPTDEEFEERLRMNSLYHYASHNWGYHACNATAICEGVIDFLESSPNVESSAQALMAIRLFPEMSNYSQHVPRKVRGLHLAAHFGALAETRILLRANNPDLKDEYDQTAIFYATRNGHGAVVKLLLESGAKGDLEDCEGQTPLSHTACYGQEGTMQLLLEDGAEADLEDRHGQTPLSHASENGHEDLVRLLLEEDVEVDSKDCDRRTPLSFATEMGHAAVVQLLLENSAKVDSEDINRRTPLSYAAEGGYLAVVQLLLKNGAQANFANQGRRTALSYAAEGGYLAVVRLLLENSAKADSEDSRGRTPLAYTVVRGHKEVADLLLNKLNPSPFYKTPFISLSKSTAQQRSMWASFHTDTSSIPSELSGLKRSHPDDDTLSPAVPSKSSRV
ncbi:Inversin-B [Fusarium oxysporum f. sp. rapae]|uniref:Inversin-B n=1 Tax=Fusarium oxysporum f. sp. rapae TaxID=485398 RepID=A0A8J5TU81_FUSOX|nr:Inversin-B [Fusarium oxysporum f. sp. rapae]